MFNKLKNSFYRFKNNSSPITTKQNYDNYIYILKDGDNLTEIEEKNINTIKKLRLNINSMRINNCIKKYINSKKELEKQNNINLSTKIINTIKSKKKRKRRRRRRKRNRI